MSATPLIFVSAGEASGDHYGAELITNLRQVLPGAHFTGLGGTSMEAAGQQRVVRAEDVAVMGITEILRHIPRIVRSYRLLVRSIQANPPSVAVLIDFPDVNFRLAKHLHRLGVPVMWFVSPQLWAWKRSRLRWVQSRVSRMLTIFPFEETFYRNRGVDAAFVGHPLAEAPLPAVSREQYAEQARSLPQDHWLHSDGILQSSPLPAWAVQGASLEVRYALDPARQWIALLPGSRRGEIAAHLGMLVASAKLLGSRYDFLIPVAPGVGDAQLRRMQYEVARQLCHADPPRITFVQDARAALLHSHAAVIASGTATVQAAVLATPFVVVYRVSNTTFRIAKRLVRYPPELSAEPDQYGNLPIAMPNLIAGRRIVPELLQQRCTAKAIVEALRPLLEPGQTRRNQLEALVRVRSKLLHPSGLRSIDQVRDEVLRLLNTPASRAQYVPAS